MSAVANEPGRSGPVVGDLGFDEQGAALLGDGRTETYNAAFIDGLVAFDPDVHRLVSMTIGSIPLGHFEPQPQRMHADECDDRHARGDVLAQRRGPGPNHPGEGRRQRGVGHRLPCEIQLRPSLRQDGLTITHLFERVLIAAVGDLEGRFGGVELRARRQAAIDERADALTCELGLVQNGTGLAHHRRRLRIDRFLFAIGRESQSRPCLLQRRGRLRHPQLIVGRRQAGQSADQGATELPRSTSNSWSRPATLKLQDRLLLRREGAADGDGPAQRLLLDRRDAHLTDLAIRCARRGGRRGPCRHPAAARATKSSGRCRRFRD